MGVNATSTIKPGNAYGIQPPKKEAQQLQSNGLAAEKKLESEKGNIDVNDKDSQKDMAASWAGYKVSNPKASLDDFAKQEAGKTGLSETDIETMVNAVKGSVG